MIMVLAGFDASWLPFFFFLFFFLFLDLFLEETGDWTRVSVVI